LRHAFSSVTSRYGLRTDHEGSTAVKPSPVGYSRPQSVAEALEALADLGERGKVLAGGQSLVPLMSLRLARPEHLVDINRLAELSYIGISDEHVSVGALTRHAELLASTEAATAQPLLAQALRWVAHPAIRNRGTVVGSLVHADPSGEMPTVLALLGGTVRVASTGGERLVPASGFFLGPLESAVQPDELAVEVSFPVLAPASGTGFAEVSRRRGDYALCGVAALVRLADDGTIAEARAAYLSVGPAPVVLDLTDAIAGASAELAAAYRVAGQRAANSVDPDSDIHATAAYRRQLAAVLTERALREAAASALGGSRGDAPRSPAFMRSRRVSQGAARPADMAADDRGEVQLTINGAARTARVPARRLLSDCIRHDLGLTGTHVGCEHGVCGACTVLLDGNPVRSCLLLAVGADGCEITTIEGLADGDGTLSPVQRAFAECHGLQCGFCTPGFLTTITAGLRADPAPDDAQVREMIGGNLCRCTGYQNIVASVHRASEIIRAAELTRAGQQQDGAP
jgi:CO/xanthine dehydrogenase FAD-binding subunit/aerobic-type carbon monoxide dehydrogenase small subunit (CoxS/CutS family)